MSLQVDAGCLLVISGRTCLGHTGDPKEIQGSRPLGKPIERKCSCGFLFYKQAATGCCEHFCSRDTFALLACSLKSDFHQPIRGASPLRWNKNITLLHRLCHICVWHPPVLFFCWSILQQKAGQPEPCPRFKITISVVFQNITYYI